MIKKLVANYVGGVGYYALVFGWLLVVFYWCMLVMRFTIGEGQPALDISYIEAVPAGTSASSGVSNIVLWVFAVPFVIVLIGVVVALPYLIAKATSKPTLWLIDQTNSPHSLRSLLMAKQLLVLLLVVTTLLCVVEYSAASTDSYIGYFTLASASLSLVCFWAQHLLAKVWVLKVQDLY